MKQLKLSVTKRETRGSSAAGRMRRAGEIPAVIYSKDFNEIISVNDGEFRKMMRKAAGSAALIELTREEGESTLSIIKNFHRDAITDKFLHIDFSAVSRDEEMTMTIPVHVEGECFGVKNENGVIEIPLHQVEIRCLPGNLPEYIRLDVTELHVGESIHVKDLPALPGVTFLVEEGRVVVACSAGNKAAAVEEAEEEVEAVEGEKPAEDIKS